MTNLAKMLEHQGELSAAKAVQEESLALMCQIGDQQSIATNQHNLGNIEFAHGDLPAALVLHREALLLFVDNEARDGVTYCLEGIAGALSMLGEPIRALQLWPPLRPYVPPSEPLSHLTSSTSTLAESPRRENV